MNPPGRTSPSFALLGKKKAVWWRRRESNPRPGKFAVESLHAYPVRNFRLPPQNRQEERQPSPVGSRLTAPDRSLGPKPAMRRPLTGVRARRPGRLPSIRQRKQTACRQLFLFRSFYGCPEPGTPLNADPIPSKPVRPHPRQAGYAFHFSMRRLPVCSSHNPSARTGRTGLPRTRAAVLTLVGRGGAGGQPAPDALRPPRPALRSSPRRTDRHSPADAPSGPAARADLAPILTDRSRTSRRRKPGCW